MPATHQTFQSVARVVVPCVDGRVGILPRHASMIFKLKSGIVSMYPFSGKADHFFVWGGIQIFLLLLCKKNMVLVNQHSNSLIYLN